MNFWDFLAIGGGNGQHRQPDQEIHSRPAEQSNYGSGYPAPYPFPVKIPNPDTRAPLKSVPKSSLKSEGIRAGEIIAFRCWMISGESRPRLLSVYMSHIWEPDVPMTMTAGTLTTPQIDHTMYGVHAFKSPGLLFDEYYFLKKKSAIFGTVALWGDVVEHEKGYRAQYGRINTLDFCHDKDLLDRFRKVYGVKGKTNPEFETWKRWRYTHGD